MGACCTKSPVVEPEQDPPPYVSLVITIPLPLEQAEEITSKEIEKLLAPNSLRDIQDHLNELWFTARYNQTDLVVTNKDSKRTLYTIKAGISLDQARKEMVMATFATVEGGEFASKLRQRVWLQLEPIVNESKPKDLTEEVNINKWRDAKAQVFNWTIDLVQLRLSEACKVHSKKRLEELGAEEHAKMETAIRQTDLKQEQRQVQDMLAESRLQEQQERIDREKQQEYKVQLAIEEQKRRIRAKQLEDEVRRIMRNEPALVMSALYS